MKALTEILNEEVTPPLLVLECIRKGEPCFYELIELLKSGRLNEIQQVNALELLCSLVSENLFHRGFELVDTLSSFATHENIQVRSRAAGASIRFVRAAEEITNFKIHPMTRETVATRLRSGLELGFQPEDLLKFIRKFVEGTGLQP